MGETVDDTEIRERLVTGYTGHLSLACALGWLATRLGRDALPPLLPTIIADLAISPAEAGFGLTVLWGVYSLNLYPGGRMADQLSRRTIVVGSLVMLILGNGLLTRVEAYTGFMLGVVIVGIGAGQFFISTRSMLADLFVDRRGQAFGIQSAAGSLGSALSAGLAVLAISLGTWQNAFFPVMALLAVTLFFVHHFSEEPYSINAVELGFFETGRRLFSNQELRRLLFVYILYAVTVQGFVGFLPVFLQSEKAFSAVAASAGFAVYYIAGTVISPLSGNLGDRFGHISVAAGALGFSIVGLAILIWMPLFGLAVAGIIILSIGIRAFAPVMQAYLMSSFSGDNLGGDFGAFKMVYTGIGSIGPTYVGLVAEHMDYTVAFVSLIPCLLVALGLLLLVTELQS